MLHLTCIFIIKGDLRNTFMNFGSSDNSVFMKNCKVYLIFTVQNVQEYGFSLTCALPHNARNVDSVLILDNTGQ